MRKLMLAAVIFTLSLLAGAQQAAINQQVPGLAQNNVFSGSDQFLEGVTLGPQLFSSLGSSAANGSITYCADCQVTNPCSGGGLGAVAQRINGTWQCGGGGGSSAPGGSNTQVQFNSSGFLGGSSNLTWVSPALTIGVASSTTGQLGLASAGGGVTLLQSASPGGGTATLPSNTGILAETNFAQTWTSAQTFSGSFLLSNGANTIRLVPAGSLGANRAYTLPDSGGDNFIQLRAGAVTAGNCAKFDTSGNIIDSGGACGGGSGSPGGANTQVQFNSLSSFAGSPNLTWVSPMLTIGQPGSATGQLGLAGGGGNTTVLTTSSTAGGTWVLRAVSDNVVGAATADAFTNKTYDTGATGNQFLVAGHAISGAQGNAGLIQLSTGATTTNDCAKFDASGNIVDSGGACATASAAGTTGQIQYNGGSSNLAASAALTFVAPTLTVGQAGASTGILALTGSTGGSTSLTTAAAAGGTWTFRNATDNVVGDATTDTFTNKTLDTAGAGNSLKINGTAISAVTGTGAVVLATSPTIGTSLAIGGTSNQLAFTGNVNSITLSVVNPAASRIYTLPDSGGNNKLALTAGALTAGDCAKFDASGNIVDVGAACGSATPGAPASSVQFNSAGSFAGSANLSFVSPTLTIGAAGAATGQLALAGSTSGTLTLTTTTAAGGTATFANASGTVGLLSSTLGSGQIVSASGAATMTSSANLTWSSPKLTIGVAGSVTGQLALANATSNSVILQAASGGGTITVPAVTATMAVSGQDLSTTSTVTSTHITGGTSNVLAKFNASGNLVTTGLTEASTTLTSTDFLNIAPTAANPSTGAVFIGPTDTTTPSLIIVAPANPTADILDVFIGSTSNPKQFFIDASGVTNLQPATANNGSGAQEPSLVIPNADAVNGPPTVPTQGWWWANYPRAYYGDGTNIEQIAADHVSTTFLVHQQINSESASAVPLTVKGFSGQTGDLLDVQDSSGAVRAGFNLDSLGDFGVTAEFLKTAKTGAASGSEEFAATATDVLSAYPIDANVVRLEASTSIPTSFGILLPSAPASAGSVQVWLFDNCPSVTINTHSETRCTSSIGQLGSTALSDSSTLVHNNQANSYTAGMRQTFTASATTAGLALASVAADPSSLSAGDAWYRSDLKHLSYSDGTATHRLMTQDDVLLAAQEPAHLGDATNSQGSLTLTVGKVNGVSYGTSPATNTVPVVTSANTTTYEQIPQAAIANGAVGTSQIANGAVGSAQLATSNRTRTCGIVLGDESQTALSTGAIAPQKSQCYGDVAMTVTQILVLVDSGASTVQLGYRHSTGGAPTVSNYTAAVMTPATVTNITDHVVCANAGGTAITVDGISVTCGTLATQTWNQGDLIETVAGTADGTTKRMSIFITATRN